MQYILTIQKLNACFPFLWANFHTFYILNIGQGNGEDEHSLNFQFKVNNDQLAVMDDTLFYNDNDEWYLIMHEWTPPLLERQRMPFARCAAEIPTRQSASKTRSLKITFFKFVGTKFW